MDGCFVAQFLAGQVANRRVKTLQEASSRVLEHSIGWRGSSKLGELNDILADASDILTRARVDVTTVIGGSRFKNLPVPEISELCVLEDLCSAVTMARKDIGTENSLSGDLCKWKRRNGEELQRGTHYGREARLERQRLLGRWDDKAIKYIRDEFPAVAIRLSGPWIE
jgi:hypothetical protein